MLLTTVGRLENVNPPDTLIFIGENTFDNYFQLKNIIIPDSVTSLNGVFRISGISRIVIQESVDSISDYEFYGCFDLQEIELPSTLASIGECAFARCYNLREIKIPGSVVSIGEKAFFDCENLTIVELPPNAVIASDAFEGTPFGEERSAQRR